MFGSDVRHTQTLVIDADPGGDAEIFYLMRAPKDLTVEAAYMVAEAAQGAGTAVRLQLENWGTAGTGVVTGGTPVAYVGGTAAASQLSARTPGAGSVNRAQNYITEGQWLVVNYNEQAVGWVSGDRFQFVVEYVLGKGNTTSTS